MRPIDARTLRILGEIADQNEPCPTLMGLSHMIDISPAGVNDALNRLSCEGHISMDVYHSFRVVTITATGKSTREDPSKMRARAHGKSTGRNRIAQSPDNPFERPIRTIPVSRDPCPRCGIPQFKGCAHVRPDVVAVSL